MKIKDDQATPRQLSDLGVRAAQLLCAGDFSSLAQQFGYALAYDRDPAVAIRQELGSSLAEIGASKLCPPPATPPWLATSSQTTLGFSRLLSSEFQPIVAGMFYLNSSLLGRGLTSISFWSRSVPRPNNSFKPMPLRGTA